MTQDDKFNPLKSFKSLFSKSKKDSKADEESQDDEPPTETSPTPGQDDLTLSDLFGDISAPKETPKKKAPEPEPEEEPDTSDDPDVELDDLFGDTVRRVTEPKPKAKKKQDVSLSDLFDDLSAEESPEIEEEAYEYEDEYEEEGSGENLMDVSDREVSDLFDALVSEESLESQKKRLEQTLADKEKPAPKKEESPEGAGTNSLMSVTDNEVSELIDGLLDGEAPEKVKRSLAKTLAGKAETSESAEPVAEAEPEVQKPKLQTVETPVVELLEKANQERAEAQAREEEKREEPAPAESRQEEKSEEPEPVEAKKETKEEPAPVESKQEEKKEEPAPVESKQEEKKEEPAPAESKQEEKKEESAPVESKQEEKKEEPAPEEAREEEKKDEPAPVEAKQEEKKEEPAPAPAPIPRQSFTQEFFKGSGMAEPLLTEWEPLPHNQRVKRAVALGKLMIADEAESDTVRAQMAALARGGFYERRLSIFTSHGSRESAIIFRALKDPSSQIRRLATNVAALYCSDTEVTSGPEKMPRPTRELLIKALYKRKREQPIDSILSKLLKLKDPQTCSLIPYGSEQFLNDNLSAFADRLSHIDWRRLSINKPDVVLKHLTDIAAGLQYTDWNFIWRVNCCLPYLAGVRPTDTVQLVARVLENAAVSDLELEHLLRRKPNELTALFIERKDFGFVDFAPIMHKLDEEKIIHLISHHSSPRQLWPWFNKLKPEVKARLYKACADYWRNDNGNLPLEVLRMLPASCRHEEARRSLKAHRLAFERFGVAMLLPWDEASKVIQPNLAAPDIELRAAALSALVSTCRYERGKLGELLQIILKKASEPDQVRCAILEALIHLPPSIWKEENLEDLGAFIRDSLTAEDSSDTCAEFICELIVKILPLHQEWGASLLTKLMRSRGYVQIKDLPSRLNQKTIEYLAPYLKTIISSWESKERDAYLLSFARDLGCRLRQVDSLTDAIERLVKRAYSPGEAMYALSLLSSFRGDRIPELVLQLLENDKSWVIIPIVRDYLHRRRQDILAPYFNEKRVDGRFFVRDFLPVFRNGFFRWTTFQMSSYAARLDSRAKDTALSLQERFIAVDTMVRLPESTIDYLRELAKVDASDIQLRDRTLIRLGKVDSARGLPVLADGLRDNRSRAAVLGLRSCLYDMHPDRGMSVLSDAPQDSVPVVKEMVRIKAMLHTEPSFQSLLELVEKGVSRDVRLTLLRAFWEFTDREEVWKFFTDSLNSLDPLVLRTALRVPPYMLDAEGRGRLLELYLAALEHPEALTRASALAQLSVVPAPDPSGKLIEHLSRAIESASPEECRMASTVFLHRYAAGNTRAVEELIAKILPERAQLQTFLEELQLALGFGRARLVSATRAAVTALGKDELTVAWQIKICAAALPWKELSQLLVSLSDSGKLHAGAIAAVMDALNEARHRADLVELDEIESDLSSRSAGELRRIGLGILITLAESSGWTKERLEKLKVYRRDSSPLVASVAQFTLPPMELEQE